MNLNGWDYYDLTKELNEASVSQLLEIYKREDKKYSDKCLEYVNNMSKLTEEGKQDLHKECEFLEGGTIIIALKVADALTK